MQFTCLSSVGRACDSLVEARQDAHAELACMRGNVSYRAQVVSRSFRKSGTAKAITGVATSASSSLFNRCCRIVQLSVKGLLPATGRCSPEAP